MLPYYLYNTFTIYTTFFKVALMRLVQLCIYIIANVRQQFIDELFAPRYIMPMILYIYQHCNEQQFRDTVMYSCVSYTISSVVKLDLCIRTLLLDHNLALKKKHAYASRASCFYSVVSFIIVSST